MNFGMNRKLELTATRRPHGNVVIRDYKEVPIITWRRHLRGTLTAHADGNKIAVVTKCHSTLWELDYNFSFATRHCSGGCRRDTPQECQKYLESLYLACRSSAGADSGGTLLI